MMIAIGTVLLFLGTSIPSGYEKVPDSICEIYKFKAGIPASGPQPICIVKRWGTD